MSQIVIRTEGLGRSFGAIHAVIDVSFEVRAGAVFGFLGPNGAGKTTTIRLLLGLLEPSAGRAEVLGFDTRLHADQIRLRCGALLEHTGLYERLSAVDNLEFYGRVWRMSAAERSDRIHELLTGLGLWERRLDIVGDWSRGMKQKLAVARTLLHHPQLVFLDEPTAGLDPVASAALREDLENLAQQEGVTIFLTTHHLAEAERLCSQVGVIRAGRLILVGNPDELRIQQSSNRVEYVGRGWTEALLNELRQKPEISQVSLVDRRLVVDLKDSFDSAVLVPLLVTHGVQIDEIRKGKASLEDVFLTLMEEET
ncbi:MAG TPA: ABC transporter ATP-binding protein [Levilinea sp.]|nr:ABC transporter ATP-binding protein [Levilinea sp.]